MFKYLSIALSASLMGSASAAGCNAAYSAGSTYIVGDLVSASVTTTTPVTYTPCSTPGVGTCTANGFVLGGGVTTTESFNYECNSEYWCSNAGFAPGGPYSDLAWTKDSTACTGSAGTASKRPTNAPTSSPTAAIVGGCPGAWAAGGMTTYTENQQVSVTVTTTPLVQLAYKCKAWPYSGFCGQFSPLDAAGGSLGWTYVGGCSGTITPTSSPTYDPSDIVGACPGDYNSATTSYVAGSQVSLTVSTTPLKKIVYECKAWPNSGYCNQSVYAPGGTYSDMGWTLVGPCEGTFAPTVAPTAFAGDCMYVKVVTTTPTPTPTVMNIAAWSSSTLYEAGDQVRIDGTTYKCKPWPFYFWCRMAAYQPTKSSTGLWTEAWTNNGACEYVSLPPTAAPTAAPTGVPTVAPTANPTAAPM